MHAINFLLLQGGDASLSLPRSDFYREEKQLFDSQNPKQKHFIHGKVPFVPGPEKDSLMHFDGTVGAESVEVIWVMLTFVLNEKQKQSPG